MVDVFDQHLENLDFIGWAILILLCIVVHLYTEKDSMQKSNERLLDILRKKHQNETEKLKKEIEELKRK
jgi:cell division protein FtsB